MARVQTSSNGRRFVDADEVIANRLKKIHADPARTADKESQEDLSCQFCGEDGFDLIGLKAHMLRHCDVFDDCPSPEEEQRTKMEALKEIQQ
jgi:hypothetical protein